MIIRCPTCGGHGHMNDGSCILSNQGMEVTKKPTICYTCNGKRWLYARPAMDSEIQEFEKDVEKLNWRYKVISRF